jgi:hypothetical protein
MAKKPSRSRVREVTGTGSGQGRGSATAGGNTPSHDPRRGHGPVTGASGGKPAPRTGHDQVDPRPRGPQPDGPAATPGLGVTGPDNPPPGLNPGIPTPPVEPFLTPEQMQALSQATRDYNIQVNDLDYALGIQKIDTAYQQGELDKQATAQTASTTDDMIRRGLFQSSIRDGALADITGTNATSKARLNDLLTAATIHTDTSERVLGHALDDMRSNYNVLAAQNAADAGKDQNPWLVEPGTSPPPASTTQPDTLPPTSPTQPDTKHPRPGETVISGTGTGQGVGSTTPVRGQGSTHRGHTGHSGTVTGTSSGQGIGRTSAVRNKPITMSASGYVAAAKKRMRGRL